MADTTILVLGATGTVGRRLTDRLRAAGHDVRAASRHGPVEFDWSDPGTWPSALADVSRLYLLAPDGVPVAPEFVALAGERGIERIVLQSSSGIETMGDQRLITAERIVRDCGVDWTILRPGWFYQNFDEGFLRDAVRAGRLALPVGDSRQPFVDAGDIAAVAAAALTEDGHAGAGYELTGPRSLSFAEALAAIGQAIGRRLEFDGSVPGYVAAQEAFGRTGDEVTAEVAAFTALAAAGDAAPTDVVSRVTGREPRSFETYVADAAARGAWQD